MIYNMLPNDHKKTRKQATANDFRLIWDENEVKEQTKRQTVDQQKTIMRMFAAGFKKAKNKMKK
jgi:hypothetical protein